MRRFPNRPAGNTGYGEAKPLGDYLADESGDSKPWEGVGAESLAEKVTRPLVEKMREEIRKIDVSKFKK